MVNKILTYYVEAFIVLVGNWHPDYIGPGVLPTSQIFLGTVSRFAANNLYYCKRIGDYQCSDAYEVDRRSPEKAREMYHIFFILSGQLHVDYRGHSFVAPQGSVVVLDCRLPHRYYCKNKVNFIWLDIDGGATAAYVKLLIARNVPMFQLPNFNRLVNRMMLIGHEMEEQTADEHINSSFWHGLFAMLASTADRQNADARSRVTDYAVQYIQQNFAKKLTLEELAAQCGISVYHFIRLFKQAQNCTPHEYIVGVRLRQGIHLLLTTTLPVSEIAVSVGFHSSAHFSSCFKANYGMTPQQYRFYQPER